MLKFRPVAGAARYNCSPRQRIPFNSIHIHEGSKCVSVSMTRWAIYGGLYPVDCNTRQPVDARAGAAARTSTKHGDGDANTNNNNGAEDTGSGGGGGGGGTARSISVYSDGPSPGWNWMVYGDQWAIPVRPGFGAGGSTAGRTLNTPYSSPQPPPKHPLTTP